MAKCDVCGNDYDTASRREAHSIVARTVPRRVAFLASTIA
jgi:hypothetical protein